MVFACMGTLGAGSPWAEKHELHGFPKTFKTLVKQWIPSFLPLPAPGGRRMAPAMARAPISGKRPQTSKTE